MSDCAASVDTDEDLEALFEQIASARQAELQPLPAEPTNAAVSSSTAAPTDADGSMPDLALPSRAPSPLTLPDSLAASADWGADVVAGEARLEDKGIIIDRIGRLTRNLHDALRELGYDKTVVQAVDKLPDARDRLAYIATLTGQAAERTLSALEQATPVQERLGEDAGMLAAQWDSVLDGTSSFEDFRPLVLSTRAFFERVPQDVQITKEHLLDIMMAQDFHDLTGQVIRKIVDLAQHLEAQLLQLLIDSSGPPHEATPDFEGHLNGPVIRPEGRHDVITNQAQVDELLDSLGF